MLVNPVVAKVGSKNMSRILVGWLVGWLVGPDEIFLLYDV